MPARRGVHDHQVVPAAAFYPSSRLGELPHLAEAEKLPHPGSGHRKHLEHLACAEEVSDAAGLDVQVLLHCMLRIDGDREQARCQLDLRESAALAVEGPLKAALAGELDDDRTQTPSRRNQSERCRDGGLPDAALAGHEQQVLVEQAGHGGST